MTRAQEKSVHYPALDGLRGVAVLMVVYGHAGYRGWVPLLVGCATAGVILFFFLSGFLMGSHYLPDDSLKTRPRAAFRYWSSFLLRRFVRVYPPYFFAPVVGYLLLMPAIPPNFDHAVAPGDPALIGGLLRLLALQQSDAGIYWTVRIELFFYLVYPLVVAIFVLFGRRIPALVGIAAGLVILNGFRHGIGGLPLRVPVFSDWGGFLALFVAGVLTAVVAERAPRLLRFGPRQWNATAVSGLAAFFAAVAVMAWVRPTQAEVWQAAWLFAPLLFVLFVGLRHANGLVTRLLSSRVATLLGRVSYSLYLTHIIAFTLASRWFTGHDDALTGGLAAAALAAVYFLAVERPFVRLSRRIVVSAGEGESRAPVAAGGDTTAATVPTAAK